MSPEEVIAGQTYRYVDSWQVGDGPACLALAVLDALRAAGYAVVKLPESSHTGDSDTMFWGDSIPVRVRWSNDIVVDNSLWVRSGGARALAAALLAAADAAEATK